MDVPVRSSVLYNSKLTVAGKDSLSPAARNAGAAINTNIITTNVSLITRAISAHKYKCHIY